MVNEFKFFYNNPFKKRCRLQIGSSFIYQGYYSIVTNIYQNGFRYLVQETGFNYYMKYENYLTTPSAAGRQLNSK
jgi:hypothetical protein